MSRIINFCLLIILQVVIAEDFPPPECKIPSDVRSPGECCKFPRVFSEASAEECGIPKRTENDQPYRRTPIDCDKQKCVLKKNNLMKNDDELDMNNLTEFLDNWATFNPQFKEAVEKSKDICMNSELPGPELSCGPKKIIFCLKTVLFLNCPTWGESENCSKLKDQMEGCQEYFSKH